MTTWGPLSLDDAFDVEHGDDIDRLVLAALRAHAKLWETLNTTAASLGAAEDRAAMSDLAAVTAEQIADLARMLATARTTGRWKHQAESPRSSAAE